jgi:membrane protease YdiL (CAAX protease family)
MNPDVDGRQPSALVLTLALLFAVAWPTVSTWFYALFFAGTAESNSLLQKLAYAIGKVVQFSFPLLFVWIATGRFPWPVPPNRNGLGTGLAFGLAVGAVMVGVYFGWLRNSSLLAATSGSVRQKLEEFHVATPAAYLALAVGYVVIHSLLEEYYWRWFVFGKMQQLLPLWMAILLSSLAFMAHHVVVLHIYLPGRFFSATLPFSLAIAVGGACWAWLNHRSGSLYGPWLSHLLLDAAIFVIGWDLLQRSAS